MTANPLDRDYPSIIVPDPMPDGTLYWFARHPDLPGCIATGYTKPQAEAQLANAKCAYIRYLMDNNLPIPEPSPIAAEGRTIAQSRTAFQAVRLTPPTGMLQTA
jgi:predicted RNase H-like HicB family nuclease